MSGDANEAVTTWWHRAGAYAALNGDPREMPDLGGADCISSLLVNEWYCGFDHARSRLAALEGELVRGESPVDKT